ncbi:MAG: family 10 glycosylhydrolase [Chloroflexota bacterium]|nr:family 10 glycosylhydrolase [Chloroflexota bacterium]
MQGLLAALAVTLGAILSTLTGTSARSVASSTPAPALADVAPSPAAPPSAAAASVSGAQLRAYFVDAFGPGMYDPAQIDAVVAAAKAANMNAIFAEVVRRGDCFCNDSTAPRTDAPIAPLPFDPLQTLIQKAHAAGIQVHAWVMIEDVWQGPSLPKDPSHLFDLHGPSASPAEDWLTKRYDGFDHINEEYFIDLGDPDAAAYMLRLVESIVASYDVDGIDLDGIRYPDDNLATDVPSWGYNPTALARFRAETGRTDTPAPTDAQWTQWRRDRVTDFVRRVYVDSTAIRPQIRISADTVAYGYGPQSQGGWASTRTYAELLQDWVGWMREGIVDLNIPMVYKRDSDAGQREQYLEWNEFAKEQQYGRQAAIGSALYLNDIPASIRQIRAALAPGTVSGRSAVGWVGYSYRNPDALAVSGARSGDASRAELTTALTLPSSDDPVTPPVFAAPAAVPAMPWKAQPTTGDLRGTATAPDGTPAAHVPVEVRDATGTTLRTTATDASGWFGVVDLAPGTYSVVASRTAFTATVVAGQVATATAVGAAPCTSSVGPGIPHPASVPSGIAGFHASWYGQSGYPTLCAGQRATATVAYYNSGSLGWVAGRMGEVAYLGTWQPEPGQDRASMLGGDGTFGSPNTGWPRYDRMAVQPASYVGPGQVAWFRFTVQAPSTPGTYRLYLRPLIEGAQWMEDYGVYWVVTVR